MATSGSSDDKILLFNNNEPPWIQLDALFKKYTHKKTSLIKKKKEKALINKVQCFTENDNHEVLSARKLLFWFAKDQHWVEIK